MLLRALACRDMLVHAVACCCMLLHAAACCCMLLHVVACFEAFSVPGGKVTPRRLQETVGTLLCCYFVTVIHWPACCGLKWFEVVLKWFEVV